MTRYSKNYIEKRCKRGTPPLANIICCLIDRSASTMEMSGAPIFELKKQLEIIKRSSIKSNIDIRFTLASFNTNVEYLMNYKDFRKVIIPKREKLIDFLRPKGRTKLYTSIYKCLVLLEKQRLEYINSLPSPVTKLDPEIITSLLVLTDNIDVCLEEEMKEKIQYKLKEAYNNGLRFKIIIANPCTQNIQSDLNLKASNIIQTESNYNSITNTLGNLDYILKNIDNKYIYI
jgi:hypothetical protein